MFKVGGRKESVVKGTKKSFVDVGSNKIVKNQNGKRSSLTNADVDKASFQGSPRNSRDNHGRSKVKGKVKDFVKMFNQEVLCKPAYDGDLGSQRSKTKEKGAFRAENEASISAARMSEDLQKSNVKSPIPNASIVMNEDIRQLEKEYCEAKTASYVLSNAPGQDVSASGTG
ncbi:J domain-containing protein required for chloroplast accumulation response 1 isoform X1 [Prunus yedoensis var. nudiflora]|uniref:J domain-containing protein required for chloroplast accumulation response 1 isoform X1 n=1 Tax=Prunus yedoensis var. nudiflora TaxID=2094558 RepID=A0A314Z8Z8_PRUYE|nr:J domain-containing protein required for chloroplast accumulation response 1 isoform X1 [Prunus yedoensis var. nudiflora]